MTGNILISGATMVLPETTKLGDLRISDGVISEVSEPGTLESLEGEMFVDGTGLHLLPGCIDLKYTLETQGNQKKRTWRVARRRR